MFFFFSKFEWAIFYISVSYLNRFNRKDLKANTLSSGQEPVGNLEFATGRETNGPEKDRIVLVSVRMRYPDSLVEREAAGRQKRALWRTPPRGRVERRSYRDALPLPGSQLPKVVKYGCFNLPSWTVSQSYHSDEKTLINYLYFPKPNKRHSLLKL